MLMSSSMMTSAEMVASENIPSGFTPLSQLFVFDQSPSPAVPMKVCAWEGTMIERRTMHNIAIREGEKSLIFFIRHEVLCSKNGLFSPPKLEKMSKQIALFSIFRHKKARFSPQIADFRHKCLVLDTFSARHDAMQYFCNVLKSKTSFY